MAPFSRIHATAQDVSSPPEKAMPTFSSTGRLPSTFVIRPDTVASRSRPAPIGPRSRWSSAGPGPVPAGSGGLSSASSRRPVGPGFAVTGPDYPRWSMGDRWLPEYVLALAPDAASAAAARRLALPGSWVDLG